MNRGGSLKQSGPTPAPAPAPAPPCSTAFDPGLEDIGEGPGRSQEELDLELALRLSKADHEPVDLVQPVPELEQSQEDADRLFALRLQQELDAEAEHVTSAPTVEAPHSRSRSPGPGEERGEEQEEGGDLLGRLLGADPVLGRGRAAGAFGSPAKKVKKNKPGSCSKEYVPKPRSGAEAVLLALAQAAAQPGYPGHLGKAELQRLAQPGADQSFTLAGNRTEHYTAWAGVKTLINHELIRRWSNPAKFDITEKGVELAGRILRVGGAGGSGPTGTVHERGAEKSPAAPARKRKKTVLKDNDGVAVMRRKRLARFSADAENKPPAAQPSPSTSAANFSLGLAESFSLEGTLTEADFAGPVPLPLELQVLCYLFFHFIALCTLNTTAETAAGPAGYCRTKR